MSRLNLNIGGPASQPGGPDQVSSPGFQELLLGDGSAADQQELTTFGGGGAFNEVDARFDSILPPANSPTTPPGISRGGRIAGGGFDAGGADSSSRSQSTSTPSLLAPDAGDIRNDFTQLQGGIGLNQPQSQALGVVQDNGNTIRGLLGDSRNGQEARINQDAQTASNNVSGSLIGRGFGGSSLNLVGQQAVEGNRQQALNDLSLGRLDENIANESNTAKGLSDLLFGSANQSTKLLGGILGSAGLGNFASSRDDSQSSSRNRPNSISATLKNGGKASPIFKGSSLDAARAKQAARNQAGGVSGGGGGGGGRSRGNSAAAGATPQTTNNPHFDNDPTGQTQEGVPLDEQALEKDQGPLQTPAEFARNWARLDAKAAKAAADLAAQAQGNLAQSAGGTSGFISAGGSLA